MPQIFITGTSGIGKTTLAKYISQRYRIPFVEGSSKVLWDKYHIKTHKELMDMAIKDPKLSLQFQIDLLEIRMQNMINNENLVSDRSFVDNFVYFLLQNSTGIPQEETEHYLGLCREYAKLCKDPKYIYLSHNLIDKDKFIIENDGKRIDNPFFQNHIVGPIFDDVLKNDLLDLKLHNKNFKIIRYFDWETRVHLTEDFVKDKLITGLKTKYFTAWLKENPFL
jgi:ABC-type oligopeptide transport system ATPase subunit